MEASTLEIESKSLKLEIINLKTAVDRQLKSLDTITKELKDAKNINIEKENIIKSEAAKFQRIIKDSNIRSDTQSDGLKKDITVKNEIITTLQKE